MDRIASAGEGNRHPLPVGRPGDGSNDFSFSGLKTAMLRELQKRGVDGRPIDPAALDADMIDLLASFQRAIVTALVDRVEAAHTDEGIRALALSGGVAANSELRRTLLEWGASHGVPVFLPERAFTTDNAAMIAFAGLLHYRRNETADPAAAAARSRWPLGS